MTSNHTLARLYPHSLTSLGKNGNLSMTFLFDRSVVTQRTSVQIGPDCYDHGTGLKTLSLKGIKTAQKQFSSVKTPSHRFCNQGFLWECLHFGHLCGFAMSL